MQCGTATKQSPRRRLLRALVVSAVLLSTLPFGCTNSGATRQSAGTRNWPPSPGLTDTLFFGTLDGPIGFFIGAHVGTNQAQTVAALMAARIQSVSIIWPTGLGVSTRRQLTDSLATSGIAVAELSPGERRLTPGRWPVLLLATSPRTNGAFVCRYLGKDVKVAARELRSLGVRSLAVESVWKLLPETTEKIQRTLDHAGIAVEQFWVPSATAVRGMVDLKAPDA